MNTIVQVLLAQAFNLVEYLIQTEGPAVLNWVLAEVAALEASTRLSLRPRLLLQLRESFISAGVPIQRNGGPIRNPSRSKAP